MNGSENNIWKVREKALEILQLCMFKLQNVALANALQLEAARRRASPYYALITGTTSCEFEVAQPIHCRLIAFLLLIRYVTL